jgi:8-oxo-dGTP diphosphatase
MSAEAPPDPAYLAGLTRVRAAAGALFRDWSGRVLVVRPAYKDTAEIPGGGLEPGESPRQACQREIVEELGIVLPVGDLLCVDWTPPRPHWDGGLMFVFDGGILTPDDTDRFQVAPGGELAGWDFVPAGELAGIMVSRLARRLLACIAHRDGGALYLEDGHPHPLPGRDANVAGHAESAMTRPGTSSGDTSVAL